MEQENETISGNQWSPKPSPEQDFICPKAGFDELTAAALFSEKTYFGLSAHEDIQDGWRFSYMPGLEAIPSACVCLLDTRSRGFNELARLIKNIEEKFVSIGASRARFYINEIDSSLFSLMESRGYRPRMEFIQAFTGTDQAAIQKGESGWKRVSSERDWVDKQAIQAPPSLASDGYDVAPGQWVSLERKKSETGKIVFWLFDLNGRPVATTGLMHCPGNIVRIKNFFVRSNCRGRGVGKNALRELLRVQWDAGKKAVVVLSIEGSVGHHLYRSAGGREVGRIYEWTRSL